MEEITKAILGYVIRADKQMHEWIYRVVTLAQFGQKDSSKGSLTQQLYHHSAQCCLRTSTLTSRSTPPMGPLIWSPSCRDCRPSHEIPSFHSMFSHHLIEKELSKVEISDMSIEACQAFLDYIYGNIQPEEFMVHRLALLQAADKYDISDLKEACHESLIEDIDSKNVLERLQSASLYQLPKLKSSCMRYLVKFGKIYDIHDDFNAFLQCADRELISEIFNEVLAAWKGF